MVILDEMICLGMFIVILFFNGMYVMSYEVIGLDYLYGEVYVKILFDGWEWGDLMDVGIFVLMVDGWWFINGLYVMWIWVGGKDGMIFVFGK